MPDESSLPALLRMRSLLLGLWLMAMVLSAFLPMALYPSGESFLKGPNRLIPLIVFQALGFLFALAAAILSLVNRRWLSGYQVLTGVAPLTMQVVFWALVMVYVLSRFPL